MTLKYTLFGSPGNLQEFADKLKKKGITDVEIFGVEGSIDRYLFKGLGRPFCVVARDKSKKYSYTEKLYFSESSTSLPFELEKKLQAGDKTIKKAKEWRAYFSNLGLRAEVLMFHDKKPVVLTDEVERKIREESSKVRERIAELYQVESEMRH